MVGVVGLVGVAGVIGVLEVGTFKMESHFKIFLREYLSEGGVH